MTEKSTIIMDEDRIRYLNNLKSFMNKINPKPTEEERKKIRESRLAARIKKVEDLIPETTTHNEK